MEEAVMYGVAVALLMLGVPLWHSMGEYRKGRLVRLRRCRWWMLCSVMVMLSLTIAVLLGVAGFVLQNYSPPPIVARLSADCKIISRGVDLRASRVCDTGPTIHLPRSRKNANVPAKFRCYLDYYWTSVFQVEYVPRTSELTVQAEVEVPNAALPSNCRPGFGATWTTKEAYKVNGTYPCMFNSQNPKVVDFITDTTANCTIGEPSNMDLVRHFWKLVLHSEESIFSSSGKAGELFSRAAAAIGLGLFYSMIVTGFTRTLCQVHFHFEHGRYSDLDVVYFEGRIQLAILFITSFFGVIWLSNQRAKDDIDAELLFRALHKRTAISE